MRDLPTKSPNALAARCAQPALNGQDLAAVAGSAGGPSRSVARKKRDPPTKSPVVWSGHRERPRRPLGSLPLFLTFSVRPPARVGGDTSAGEYLGGRGATKVGRVYLGEGRVPFRLEGPRLQRGPLLLKQRGRQEDLFEEKAGRNKLAGR